MFEDRQFIFEDAHRWLPEDGIKRTIRARKHEMRRRIRVLRKGKSLPDITRRTIILEVPAFFRAAARSYTIWTDVQDEEVFDLLEKWNPQLRERKS
jgi:predicted phosphoribosyltransferase